MSDLFSFRSHRGLIKECCENLKNKQAFSAAERCKTSNWISLAKFCAVEKLCASAGLMEGFKNRSVNDSSSSDHENVVFLHDPLDTQEVHSSINCIPLQPSSQLSSNVSWTFRTRDVNPSFYLHLTFRRRNNAFEVFASHSSMWFSLIKFHQRNDFEEAGWKAVLHSPEATFPARNSWRRRFLMKF